MESRLSVVRTNRLSSHGRQQHFVQELNEVYLKTVFHPFFFLVRSVVVVRSHLLLPIRPVSHVGLTNILVDLTGMAARSQTTIQKRIRTGSFRLRCGIQAVNEVAIDNAKVTGCGIALDPHLVVGRRLLNNRDSSPKTILPERSTRMAIAGRQSPIATQCRDGEWNERLNPERRNLRPDVAIERRPSIMKAAVQQQQQQQRRPGPTNPIAVGPAKTTASTTPTASSRIPRLLFNVSAGTPHRAGAYVGASPDSSGTMMDHNDSSLDLSQIGHNRSSTCSSQSSNSSLIVSSKPSRLLPPGSIVSAKLAAHYQVGRSHLVQQQSSVRATAAVSALHKPTIKSKLPVATSSVSKRPECRSTRSLPEGSTRTRVTSATTRGTPPPAAAITQQQQPNNGRPKNVVRSVVPSTSLRKTTTPDRGSVSKKKPNNTAGGLQKKEDEGGMECVSARGGGEISRGSQGKPEGSLSDPRITPPPPPPPPLLPDGVDNHLENNVTDSLLSQSAKSEESTTTSASASESSGLSSIPSFHLHSNSHGTKVESVVLIRQSESMAGRPVSYHESCEEKWTVRMSGIPAAESSELLTRLECERRSIRGTYLDEAPSVAADVELMELLERDILTSQQPTTPPDESVENPQRSLSLPKSFLATKYGLIGFKAALPSVRFPWRRTEGNRVTTSQTAASSSHQHPPPEQTTTSNAAHTSLPPTGPSTSPSILTRRPPGSASITRTARRFKSTSSPVFIEDDDRVNRSHSAWDLASRPWSHFGEMSVNGSELAETISVASITEVHTEVRESTTTTTSSSNNSTLRKFRKSFSLRLSRRPSQDDTATNQEEDQDGESSEQQQQQTSPKFRFGPLVWRASRERNSKKGAANKAARNLKCNSGDSGVQMETTSQHMDETDTNVRRTQSDLGGEAVIAAALRSTQTWNQASAIPEAAAKNRSRKLTRHLAKTHLRRSASQPVVILPAGAGRIRPDGPSDEDAGLCLSEDDNLSDCGNSPQAENEVVRYTAATEGVLAIALWDHNAVESEELSLQSGDVVHILDLSDPNWWWAARGQTYGWLPASYVQLCEQPFHRQQGLAQGQKFARTLTPAGIATLQHSVRANVINELVTAERDYVKLLSDLVDGYLKPMKSRPDLFSHQRIQSIFGNLEALYQFQKSFLVDLEHSLNWNALEDSVVGGCFLQHIQEFAIYATYCNNQDRAAAEMQLLCDDMRYLRFFEACRLLRRMIRLPLEAFLLSPVQKICKYPLQLAELLKHTPDEHPDRRLVSLALDSMRSVAYLVNESKRRAEMQQYLVHWQSGVDHWMGSDITTFNSRLVHQGELFKISSNGWTREVTLFLFDKELVICKKELIKRSSLVYKDRLTVEDIEVLEPLMAAVDVRPHSFQLRSFSRAKAYLLACRSAQDKNQWVSAIQHLQQHHSSDWPIFPAPNMNFGRQKMSSKRSKVKQNPALILTLEEAHLTLEGRDLPTKRKP